MYGHWEKLWLRHLYHFPLSCLLDVIAWALEFLGFVYYGQRGVLFREKEYQVMVSSYISLFLLYT